MLKRAYLTFGILLLLFYSLSWFEGWEFGNPRRFQPPGLALTGGGSSGGSHWYYWNNRSGTGWGGGGGK
jgi:hypothetical protein